MTRRVGEPPEPAASILRKGERRRISEDTITDEHLAILQSHPGFRDALAALQEELAGASPEWSRSLIWAAAADPDEAPLPARRFAEQWKVSPADALRLAYAGAETEPGEANAIAIQETPGEFVLRIPRPLTRGRREAVEAWLRTNRAGPYETSWGIAEKKRQDPSPAIREALPWFVRWNRGEEPAEIWRDVLEHDRNLGFQQFHAQLVRAWERMRGISAEGVRPDRPSKGSA